MRTTFTITLAILALITAVTPAIAAPKGAVELSSDKLFQSSSFYCGYINNKWIPGRALTTTLFYSHAAERKNVLAQYKTAQGRKKLSLQKKAKTLQTQIKARSETCQSGPGNGGGGGTATPTSTPGTGTQALSFNLADTVGLALGDPSVNSFDLGGASTRANGNGSNMRKVKGDGQMEEVVNSGSASISKFLIAPNNKIYVVFSQKTNLSDTSRQSDPDGCLLAEIDKASGTPKCIDNQLNSITWQDKTKNKSIQFDSSGAIYYAGSNSAGQSVLRKNAAGQTSDLINDNIQLNDFHVMPDGRVIITGYTTSTNAQWIRRVSAQGGLTNLYTSTIAQFIRTFPDGNVYIGTWGNSSYGVVRYLANSDAVDPQVYIIGGGINGINNPLLDATSFCDNGQYSTYQGFCGFYGSLVKGLHRTTSGKMFAIAGYGDLGELMQYYPSLSRPNTSIQKVSVFQGVIDNLVLAGLNSQNKYVMTLFNTTDSSELSLIGPNDEIEVYHINYVAAENKIMFDGLRFVDNKYVLGQYDLNSMALSSSQTGSTKLVDFQTF